IQYWELGVLLLAHVLESLDLGRLDADEDIHETGSTHQFQKLGLFCDIERRLAGKCQREAVLLLPPDQMRQQFTGRFAVSDEIVVNEINRLRLRCLAQNGIELGDDLLAYAGKIQSTFRHDRTVTGLRKGSLLSHPPSPNHIIACFAAVNSV